MKTTIHTCDRCGKQFDAKDIATFHTKQSDGTYIPHDFCQKGCMQEAGIAMLNIIDKKGVLAKALDMLWDTLTAEEKTATVEIALRSNTRQERDDDAETGEDTAQPNT